MFNTLYIYRYELMWIDGIMIIGSTTYLRPTLADE